MNNNTCSWPRCIEPGEYKAPKTRNKADGYQWFCLLHIRIFNSKWDYCKGMTDKEVEARIVSDMTWNRQTWPMGSNTFNFTNPFTLNPTGAHLYDEFELLSKRENEVNEITWQFTKKEQQAINLLGLTTPISKTKIKDRYKTLVKRYHPDTNGGDKKAEENLKCINDAYETLLKSLSSAGLTPN